jgi:hypothetical protein
VQFLLSLPGRSEDSKEKENRKDDTHETQRKVHRKGREAWEEIGIMVGITTIQTN